MCTKRRELVEARTHYQPLCSNCQTPKLFWKTHARPHRNLAYYLTMSHLNLHICVLSVIGPTQQYGSAQGGVITDKGVELWQHPDRLVWQHCVPSFPDTCIGRQAVRRCHHGWVVCIQRFWKGASRVKGRLPISRAWQLRLVTVNGGNDDGTDDGSVYV